MIEDSMLDKYLSNELSAQDRSAVELALSKDDALSLRLQLLKSQKTFLKNQDAITEAKTAIADLSQEFRESKVEPSSPNIKRRLFYLIPAAVAALLIIGLFIRPLISSTNTSASEFFGQYFEPAQLSLLTKSDSNTKLMQSAQLAFNQKQYSEAIVHLKELLSNDPTNEQYIFNLAIAELGVSDHDVSLSRLQPLLDHPIYGSGATWYSALAHLNVDDIEKTMLFLNKIPSQSSYYKSAQALLLGLN